MTPSESPLITETNVGQVRHITAIGSDAPGKREIARELVAEAYVVVDDLEQSRKFGETQDVEVDRARLARY